MKKSGLLLLTLVGILFLSSCKKEEIEPDNPENNGNTNPPATGVGTLYSGNNIYASVFGQVIDDAGLPVENATVYLSNTQTSTDEDGTFLFENVSVDESRAYIKVEKAGYFMGSRAFVPDNTTTSIVKIQMLSRNVAGTFDNGIGGTVNVNGGPQLVFDPQDVALENGSAYSGMVSVYAKYLNPDDADLLEYMPGDLRALNANGDAVVLGTYGMVNVELEGSNGEKLNVAPGAEVSLQMPITSNLQANAPSTIPLWYFDDVQGNWVEDGSADKVGNTYVGSVTHFTPWNIDVPFQGKTYIIQVVDPNGNPIPSTIVGLRNDSYLMVAASMTNINGYATGICPEDAQLDVIIYDQCYNETEVSQVYSTVGGPQHFGTITITPQVGIQMGTLTGTLVDCSNQVVPNGLVYIKDNLNVTVAQTDANGNFNVPVFYCASGSIGVSGYDMSSYFNGSWQQVPGAPVMDAGVVMACPPPNDYVIMVADGTTYYWDEQSQGNSIFANETAGSSHPGDTNMIYVTNQMYFFVPDIQPGPYMNCNYPVYGSQFPAMRIFSAGIDAPENSISINLTGWGGIGGQAEGNFSGVFNDLQGNPHTITAGEFSVSIQ